jgi:ABC-type sugar transport system ATPase subunit
MADTPLIAIRGLRKSFGDVEVLKGVDLVVRRGEVVSLIGP